MTRLFSRGGVDGVLGVTQFVPDLTIIITLPVIDFPVSDNALYLINEVDQSRILTHLYKCVITGAPDSLSDVEIPVESFTTRKRSGSPTYLSIVVKDAGTYADLISNRSNGEIVMSRGYILTDGSTFFNEIVRTSIDDIKTFEGGDNSSVGLVGYKTVSSNGKSRTLYNPKYRAVSNGKRRFRLPVDNFIEPGDEVTIGAETFVIDFVTITESENDSSMELSEL